MEQIAIITRLVQEMSALNCSEMQMEHFIHNLDAAVRTLSYIREQTPKQMARDLRREAERPAREAEEAKEKEEKRIIQERQEAYKKEKKNERRRELYHLKKEKREDEWRQELRAKYEKRVADYEKIAAEQRAAEQK
jgi:hypothetical protein